MITGEWENADQIANEFEIDPDSFDRILYAEYYYEDYEGNAFVVFVKDGKMYEVNGAHCSCYGLEGQWEPEEISAVDFEFRRRDGRNNRYARAWPWAAEYWGLVA